MMIIQTLACTTPYFTSNPCFVQYSRIISWILPAHKLGLSWSSDMALALVATVQKEKPRPALGCPHQVIIFGYLLVISLSFSSAANSCSLQLYYPTLTAPKLEPFL